MFNWLIIIIGRWFVKSILNNFVQSIDTEALEAIVAQAKRIEEPELARGVEDELIRRRLLVEARK